MIDLNPVRWPCLKEDGLRVFNTTADQRYLLGEDLFLKTHFPMQVRRYQNNRNPALVTENDLLNDIAKQNGAINGNRVFFLYGAAGAGKSELLRWLQASLISHSPERSKFMVRINRNELDILSIVEKFNLLLPDKFFSESTYRRWDEARRKPRTVAKLILLSALEKIFDSDTTINTLFYRLLEWIQPRIEQALASERLREDYDHPIELLCMEDLKELEEQSVFDIHIEYEQFRYFLSKAFQDLLLEGSSLPDTLQNISNSLTRLGNRPILLVDDLVQSLSIFSTDILDYFITLDEGNWDVVIGLTPHALADNARGQQLLDRISYLDTFDDRVSKLFLSDIRGDESYFLNEENCAEFLIPYLLMFRSINNVTCVTCPYVEKCRSVFGDIEGSIVAPFNSIFLRRIFGNLPDGKGKARQFLRAVRDILNTMITTGKIHDQLANFIKVDFAAECTDKRLSKLIECYYPYGQELKQEIVSEAFLSAFNFDISSAVVNIQPLRNEIRLLPSAFVNGSNLNDSNSMVVKDWLDGNPINRQSILQLRRGTARWLRDVLSIGFVHRPGKPKPHRVLRWQGIYLDVRPPILLEGVDDGVGIYLSPNIGFLAFHLNEYANALGSKRSHLAGLIASNQKVIEIIQDANRYQSEIIGAFTSQVNLVPEEFAAKLITLLVILRDAPQLEGNPLLKPLIDNSSSVSTPQIGYRIIEAARLLFEDFFMLRDNLFDYSGFQQALGTTSIDDISKYFLELDVNRISPEFSVAGFSLREYLFHIQQRIQVWKNPLLSSDIGFVQKVLIRSLQENGVEGLTFANIPFDVWEKIRIENPEVFNKLRVYCESTHP